MIVQLKGAMDTQAVVQACGTFSVLVAIHLGAFR